MAPGITRAGSKDATRKALLEAGLSELIEHGRKSPSLDAICERAGYTRGAFYVHFENREEFNVAVMEHVTGKFLDLVVIEERGDDLRQTVTRFVQALSEGTLPPHAERALDEILEASGRSPAVRKRFLELLQEIVERVAAATLKGQESGEIRGDVDTTAVSTLLVALAIGVMMLKDAEVPLDLPGLARTVMKLVESANG